MQEKKWNYKTWIALAVILWIVFMWLHTFTYLTCYTTSTGIYSRIVPVMITMGVTIFYWMYLNSEDFSPIIELWEDLIDSSKETKWSTLRKSMMAVGVVAFIYLLMLGLEMWTNITMFADEKYIRIGGFAVNKRYMFDPIAFLIFPFWVQVIYKGMREEEYRWTSVFSGCVQILMSSLMSFLLFMRLPNIWLINLAILESITIIAGVMKYVWNDVKKKGNAIALVGMYMIFWGVLLSLFHVSGESITRYTYGNNWKTYQKMVAELVSGASVFGSSSSLTQNQQVLEFLMNRNNYLLSSLYYGGWVSAGIVVALLILFLIVSRGLLGKYVKYKRNYLIYCTAWWSLALRVIVGLLYSFGILALPISLPFAGKIGMYMDTIILGLLIGAMLEDDAIDMTVYKNCRIKDLFGKDELEFMDLEWDDDFDTLEYVQIQSGDKTLDCIAEEFSEDNGIVLRYDSEDENWLLILKQNEQTGMWSDVDEEDIRKTILTKFVRKNKLVCMEVNRE